MIESFQQYFNAFKHSSDEFSERKISYPELLGISWALHIVYAFYSVFALYLGVKSYAYFSDSEDFSHLILDSFSFQFQKLNVISVLFGVVFYPFLFQLGFKFWSGTFKFYAQIFDYEDAQLSEKSDEILTSAFSANLFLIMPIVGNVLSNIAFIYFIFKGLRHKFDFSSLQASLILITPLFLLFLFAIFSASYFVFLFTLL